MVAAFGRLWASSNIIVDIGCELLSEKRAQSTLNWLVDQGIDKARLSAKGYGESQPSTTCACNSCSDDQHQQNRRTTFKIIEN